jgi:hypothetical protein
MWVKLDEIPDPLNLSLFGSEAIVQVTDLFTQLVQHRVD